MNDQELKQKIGQMLMIGFTGTTPQDPEVQIVATHLAQNTLSNVILYSYNITDSTQLKSLNNFLHQHNKHLIIATDQEGGKIQRLSKKRGFTEYPAAFEVKEFDLAKAQEIYANIAQELAMHGFNLNFAPVVDLANENSEIIGKLGRSFSEDPQTIVAYAKACIEGHHQHKVLTCLKHFPGHGLVAADSHKTLPDATDVARFEELIPYYELMKQHSVDMIMTAHILNRNLDAQYPATLSPVILQRLLRARGYEGVIVSDDLFMSAIIANYSLRDAVIMSIQAGCDMIIYSNNKLACQDIDSAVPNVEIHLEIIEIVLQAIKEGLIKQEDIEQSYLRIMKLKNKLQPTEHML